MPPPAIVTAGSYQQVQHVIKGGLFGAAVEILQPDARRWLIIFTLIQGTHVELSLTGFGGKIFTLATDQHKRIWFPREGALTQMGWTGSDPSSNWTINATTIVMNDAK